MLTPECIAPGTRECSALPISRGTSTPSLCPEAIPALPTNFTPRQKLTRASGDAGLRTPCSAESRGGARPHRASPQHRDHGETRAAPAPECASSSASEGWTAGWRCSGPAADNRLRHYRSRIIILIIIIHISDLFQRKGALCSWRARQVALSRRTGLSLPAPVPLPARVSVAAGGGAAAPPPELPGRSTGGCPAAPLPRCPAVRRGCPAPTLPAARALPQPRSLTHGWLAWYRRCGGLAVPCRAVLCCAG